MARALAGLPPMVCVCASLRRAARAVTQAYERELRSVGLTSPQFTTLQVLNRRGESTQRDLSVFLAIDSTTLTRTLKPLGEQGWISSRRGEADGRERCWSLTANGRTRLNRALPLWEGAQHRLRERLGNSEWSRLLSDLAVVAGLAR